VREVGSNDGATPGDRFPKPLTQMGVRKTKENNLLHVIHFYPIHLPAVRFAGFYFCDSIAKQKTKQYDVRTQIKGLNKTT
jgi:hypothetical protein